MMKRILEIGGCAAVWIGALSLSAKRLPVLLLLWQTRQPSSGAAYAVGLEGGEPVAVFMLLYALPPVLLLCGAVLCTVLVIRAMRKKKGPS